MWEANAIDGVFELFWGFGGLASTGFFYFIYRLVAGRQAQFRRATALEGLIIEVGPRSYPVVEYEKDGKTHQFRSGLSAPGAQVGQRIDIEVSPNGVARIRSNGHTVIARGLLIASIACLVAGCVALAVRFA